MAPSADPTVKVDSVDTAGETTPLLGVPESSGPVASEDIHGEPIASSKDEAKPMPYIQILLLCLACLAEPVAYFSIFPFINEMIERTGEIDEKDVGFWSGMIESLFSVVQMVLMIFYGRMADRLGRKPVLVFSLAGISVCTALFGLSKGLWHMILFRCLAGTFAGSAVTIRTMISENCDKASQGRAFSWYMFTRNIGIFIGPIVGGQFANPVVQFPGIFGHNQFFKEYPYALSGFVAGAICLVITVVNFVSLKETLIRKTDGTSNPEPPMSTWEVLKSPGVPIVLYIFGHVISIGLAFTAVFPVFAFTSIQNGGFSFSPQWISYLLAAAGLSQALWMLLAFPPLQRRFGTGNVLRACAAIWPFFIVAWPIMNEFARHEVWPLFWTLGILATVFGSGVSMAFACAQLCINDISPSHTVLATVNALALTVNSGIRAVAPALFSSIFSAGVKSGWADGHLAWILITALAAGLNIALRFLPPAAEGKIADPSKQATSGEESRTEEERDREV